MEVTDQRTESSLTNSRGQGPSDPLTNDPMRTGRREGRSRSEVRKYYISFKKFANDITIIFKDSMEIWIRQDRKAKFSQ